MKKKLVISTGAGMSAESGINTFRDAGGLWENYNVMEVASADGFRRNPALIHKFYNARRKELLKAWSTWRRISMSSSSPRTSTISTKKPDRKTCFISTANS